MTSAKRAAARDEDFGPGGVAFEIDSPVNPAQLDDEIVEAMNWRKTAGLVMDGGRVDERTGFFAPVPADEDREDVEDEKNPRATVAVTHENADVKVIAKVIKDHEPDANYRASGVSLDDLAEVAAERVLNPDETALAMTLLLQERKQG